MSRIFVIVSCLLLFACDQTHTSPLLDAERISVTGEGEVAERLPAGGYTYLRLAESNMGEWLVVSHRAPAIGERVRYRGYAKLSDFHSKTLNREFPSLTFSLTTSME